MAAGLAAAAALPPGPLDFKALEMRMEPREHRVFLDGDVHLSRSDLTVTGQHALVEYEETTPPPRRKRSKQPAAAMLGGQSVRRFEVDGNVHVERGARTADGEHGVVDIQTQTIVLTGTPEAPPVLRATGENADYGSKPKEVVLTGDPKLYDRGDILSGQRIDVVLDSHEVRVDQARGKLRPEAHKDEEARP